MAGVERADLPPFSLETNLSHRRALYLSKVHTQIIELELTAESLLRGSELPAHHKDPFDRVILAQAQTLKLCVVSPDGAFPAYGIPMLW